MQLLIIALALGIFIHDALLGPAGAADSAAPLGPAALLLAIALPKLVLAGLYALTCRWVLGRLGKPAGRALVRRLDHLSSGYRYLALVLYGLDLYLGGLSLIRNTIGDLVLVDEVLIMLPSLTMILWAWWAYYPIDRRLREAGLISQIDSGRPVYPIWTRGQFLLAQVRHQVLLILAPLVLIMGWAEFVHQHGVTYWSAIDGDPRPLLVGLGALTVFLLAPILIRLLWDTTPLPPGEIRDSLVALCARHRVHVRELLLWRTFGGMINAAVMGVFAPVRYILLSDALLDMLRRDEVEAVMAHELGHVCRRHMLWLLAAAIGLLGLLELAVHGALQVAADTGGHSSPVMVAGWDASLLTSPHVVLGIVGGAAALAWIGAFGWVSRRFERQADAFAVQSLATQRGDQEGEPNGGALIDHASAETMIRALRQVARLNHLPAARRSWRHGSIAWRQAYLRSLVGCRVDDLPIDRQMRWIKVAAAVSVVIVVGVNLSL